MYKGRILFKETHKGPKHTNFSIAVLVVHRGWERAKYSRMSLLNRPLLSTSKRYHAGWYQNLLLSHCGLQQRGRGPVPFLPHRRPWELSSSSLYYWAYLVPGSVSGFYSPKHGSEKLSFTSHLQALSQVHTWFTCIEASVYRRRGPENGSSEGP